MGLYFRKSVSVGPLRFNFSGSGIGVSAGIPGFRIGTGPRGHYVHMGGGGIYYRTTLGPNSARRSRHGAEPHGTTPRPRHTDWPLATDSGVGPMREIESASVLAMADETAGELLAELNAKQATGRMAPWVAVLTAAALVAALAAQLPHAVLGAMMVASPIALFFAKWTDDLRKSTVIAFDLDDGATKEYESLVTALETLGSAQRLWHVAAEADVYDQKRNAGASTVVNRSDTRPGLGLPPFVKSNLDIPALSVGRQTLYFFPDRLLVFEAGSVGAIAYAELNILRQTTRFIEDGAPPSDARVVGHTWRYVNKSGGPDRRFNNNRQLPIMEYEQIHLTSSSGLNELLQASRVGASEMLATELGAKRARASARRQGATAATRPQPLY